jgi:hypothetical protein
MPKAILEVDTIEAMRKHIEALQQENNGWRERYDELDAGHSRLFKDFCKLQQENEQLQELAKAKADGRLYTRHDVAVILAEFMGDNCACNFNGIDELLPKYCELLKSCPDVVGVACWEQYLKHRNKLTAEQSSVVERRDKHWQLLNAGCV